MTAPFWASVENYCRTNLRERRGGNDFYKTQAVSTSAKPTPVDVLICLNWRADTAALLRQKLFHDIGDWLRKVSRWAVLNRKKLLIRRHPAERYPAYPSTDNHAALVREVDPANEFVRVVEPDEKVNTYDLMETAKVVLPYTSQVGIEAAMLGKPVVLCAHCFYSECDFAWAPRSQDEYFLVLQQACSGQLAMNEQALRHAMLCNYIFQHGMEVVTDFIPLLENFAKWSAISPENLWAGEITDGVRDLLLQPKQLLTLKMVLQQLQGGSHLMRRDA